MQREPLVLYCFRLILSFFLLVFMSMLYWSNVIIEKELKNLRKNQEHLLAELERDNEETRQIRKDVLEYLVENPGAFRTFGADTHGQASKHTQAQSSAGNILSLDPFYTKTLKKILPEGFVPNGVRKMDSVGFPDNLHPFNNFSSVSNLVHHCVPMLSATHFGKFEELSPQLALRIEEKIEGPQNQKVYRIFLRKDVYWQPLEEKHFPEGFSLSSFFQKPHKVTAEDFKLYFDAFMNPHVSLGKASAMRSFYKDVESLNVIDDYTFEVRWKSENFEGEYKSKYVAQDLTASLMPLPKFVYTRFADGKKIVENENDETYRKNAVWAQNFEKHWASQIIVSIGPFAFDGKNNKQIRLRRVGDFYDAKSALVKAIEITYKETPDAIWQDFKADNIDSYNIRSDQLIEVENFLLSDEYAKQKKQGLAISRIDYVGRSYNYIGWNQQKPFFKSAKVRRALSHAVNRKRIIEQNLNNMGIEISGPFFRYSPSYNEHILPEEYDVERAKQMLEEEGWFDSDGDGVRDKLIDGKRIPFRFRLTYYVKNPTSKAICEVVSTALKKIGVDCVPYGVDIADLSQSMDDKEFDAMYMGWVLGKPPENPWQLWHSSLAKEKGSSNFVGFANAEADRIIEALQYEDQIEKRNKLYHRFHEIIHQEAPYLFLYTPKSSMLHREYLKGVFIPKDRQDLIPGAKVASPDSSIFHFVPTKR